MVVGHAEVVDRLFPAGVRDAGDRQPLAGRGAEPVAGGEVARRGPENYTVSRDKLGANALADFEFADGYGDRQGAQQD